MATDWNEWFKREHPPALSKVWVLESTWTDMSVELQQIVEHIWRYAELGNDTHVFKTTVADLQGLLEENVSAETYVSCDHGATHGDCGWKVRPINLQPLIDYLLDKGVGPEERVWIHKWW